MISDEKLFDYSQELDCDFDNAILDLACYRQELIAESEGIKSEVKRLQERLSKCTDQSAWCKDQLIKYLPVGENVQDNRIKISWRKSKQVDLIDHLKEHPEELPIEYQRIKTIIEPDKKKMNWSLEKGINIEGISLVEKNNIQIK